MEKKIKNKNKIYPNSPLIEIVFEIRFPGEPAIECHRDRFYNEVRSEYSNILVPKLLPQQFPALQPYRFEKVDGSAGITIAINRFSYYCRKYSGYKKFKNEAMKLINKFNDIYNLNKLNRTGLRYINIIPFTRLKGIIPLNNFLNLSFKGPNYISNEFESIMVNFTSKLNNDSITLNIKNIKSIPIPIEEKEAILLDIDYAKTYNLKVKKVKKYMEESHKYNKELFEDLITDQYRKYLKGETI